MQLNCTLKLQKAHIVLIMQYFGIFQLLIFNIIVAAVVQDFYWRNYVHGDVPYDAVEAAPGLYIGQVNFKDYLLPTAIYPYRKVAITTDVKREYVKDNIKASQIVLTIFYFLSLLQLFLILLKDTEQY